MASKSANVTARVEPEIKEQAESIMNQIGVPVSVVINMLYKQIIMTQGTLFLLRFRITCRYGMKWTPENSIESWKRDYNRRKTENLVLPQMFMRI